MEGGDGKMKTIEIEYEWLRKLMPEGFPYPSSTLISGAGGTGKPLVGLAFVSFWLRSGGSAVIILLQYSTTEFMESAMNKIYKINPENYRKKIVYIQFKPSIDGYKIVKDNVIEANLLKPDVWNDVIKKAESMLEKSDLGPLIFGSSLNLLLFSPTYKEDTVNSIENIMKNDKNRTYVFSVSTSAFADEIKRWEEAADNLMYTRMEKPMRLFLKISRMKGVKFSEEEVTVPISKEMLVEMKNIAETARGKIIPELMKI